jgi:hypothetical protein
MGIDRQPRTALEENQMTRFTTMLLATAFILSLASSAFAASKEKRELPPEMWGAWCVAKSQPADAGSWTYYERRDCKSTDGFLVLSPNGNFKAHETDCKVIGYERRGWINYSCTLDGDKEKRFHKWQLEGDFLIQNSL